MVTPRLDENTHGYTTFQSTPKSYSGWFGPQGRLGKFFAKFFSRQAAPYLPDPEDSQIEPKRPLDVGDAVVNREILQTPSLTRSTGSPIMTQTEQTRKSRYREYESMDDYPEISTSFDIYADDSTQRNLRGERWDVECEDIELKFKVLKFLDNVKMDRLIWDIVRNTCKYGDCFLELVVNLSKPSSGVRKLKILDPNYIYRKENEFGYLEGFYQEIPDNNSDSTTYTISSKTSQFLPLDNNQIVHFRLHTSDPAFYPYGRSIAAAARQVFRYLKWMEDAMLIYRLARAPERRIFYIDTGNLPSSKAESYIERIKDKLKKEKYFNRNSSNIDGRFNPMSVDEDYYVPVSGRNANTKIDTLKGAENLGEVDDVKYFRDKLLATLKIPKDYVVEIDKSPERKANLAQLDVKFSRTIDRIQQCIEIGLNSIVRRHLVMTGISAHEAKKVHVGLPDPSDMFTKRKLDVEEQRCRVAQAKLGLGIFPRSEIYREYFELTDEEIELMEQEMMEEQPLPQQGMGGEIDPETGEPMPPEDEMGLDDTTYADGQADSEGDENLPPTTQKEHTEILSLLESRFSEDPKRLKVVKNIRKNLHS